MSRCWANTGCGPGIPGHSRPSICLLPWPQELTLFFVGVQEAWKDPQPGVPRRKGGSPQGCDGNERACAAPAGREGSPDGKLDCWHDRAARPALSVAGPKGIQFPPRDGRHGAPGAPHGRVPPAIVPAPTRSPTPLVPLRFFSVRQSMRGIFSELDFVHVQFTSRRPKTSAAEEREGRTPYQDQWVMCTTSRAPRDAA